MKKLQLAVLAGALGFGVAAWGQSIPTATQAMELSVFGAGTETFTGLENDRNTGMTAGVDLAFRPFFGIRPALEIRGTDPFINHGDVISQKNVLVGVRLQKTYGRFYPYLTGFFGRGELTYVGGFIVGTFRYDRTTSNVFAGGGGVDYRITGHFDLKADVQYERYKTPVTTTGTLYSTPVSVGVVYHFDFNPRHKKNDIYRPAPDRPEPAPTPMPAPDTTPAAPAPPADAAPAPAPAMDNAAPVPAPPPVVDTTAPAAPPTAAPAPAPQGETPPARTGTANPPAEPQG